MMRSISPAMEKYVQIQQTLQGGDPIESGAFKGIDAAKSSLSLMPLMRQPMIQQPPIHRAPPAARALSAGAASFRPPMPGTGRAGMLQSIAQAMGPAMQAYQQEMDTRNAIEMEMAAAEQKQRNEMEDQAYKMLHLEEQMRHNRSIEAERMAEQNEINDLKRKEKELGEGLEYLGKYPSNSHMLRIRENDISKWADTATNSEKALQAIDGMEEIFERNPKLWGKVNIQLLKKNMNDPGVINMLIRDAKVPEKEVADFQELATYTKDLLLSNIGNVSAKATNMYLEKQMSSAIPDLSVVPSAAKKMLEHIRQEHMFKYDVGTKKVEYANQGIYMRTPIKGKHDITVTREAKLSPDAIRIKEIREKYPQFSDPTQFPDDAVLEFGRQPGV